MSVFVKATPAPTPKSKDVIRMSIFYAGLLTVMAVAQLFTYEAFLELFASFEFPGQEATGYFLAALIVTLEVFALPFLLRMSLSIAFRWFSIFSGILVAVLWLFVSSWVVFQEIEAETIGFLGTVVNLMPGWWTILFSIAIGVLAAWSAWGMWPLQTKKKKRK